jgi:hypothetical protein
MFRKRYKKKDRRYRQSYGGPKGNRTGLAFQRDAAPPYLKFRKHLFTKKALKIESFVIPPRIEPAGVPVGSIV